MIKKGLIKKVEKFAYGKVKKYGVPSREQVYFTNDKGQWLAGKLEADKKVVYLGTLLMDCMIGEALNKTQFSTNFNLKGIMAHVEMSRIAARNLLRKDKDIALIEMENILNCIGEHHGVNNFSSLESEVVCNADCYKFASVEGVFIAIKYTRDMPPEELVALLSNKVEEKWSALSLKTCKKELEPQYKAIKEFLKRYGTKRTN